MLPEEKWLNEGWIDQKTFERIEFKSGTKLFSLYWELQFALYLGVALFVAGAGIVIYEHIGSLGHILAISALSILSCLGFYYIITRSEPFHGGKQVDPNPYYSYIVLLTALLIVTVFTYLEVQFGFFGTWWTQTPLLLSLLYGSMAYRFDHKGVLSLSIISLASYFGLNAQPNLQFIDDLTLNLQHYNWGLILGSFIAIVGVASAHFDIKAHFHKLYMHFAAYLCLGSALVGIIDLGVDSRYTLLGLIFSALSFEYGRRKRYTWFLTYGVFLFYVFISAWFLSLILDDVTLIFFYLMTTPALPIYAVIHYNKKWKE